MSAQADLVSVVLPVYNGDRFLRQAIESILQQTYANFELIIINDGSKDQSQALIESYGDPRIHAIQQANMGLAATLNKGISLAKGCWIARQDQDDVSFPERLAKQVDFMSAQPGCALVGTAAEIWVDDAKTDRVHRHPCSDEQLRAGLLFYNYFVHSSVMFSKAVVEKMGGYSAEPNRQPPEDYELWSRIAKQHPVANLPDVLLAYREVSSSMSRDGENPFSKKMIMLSAENIAWALDKSIDCKEVQALAHAMHRVYPLELMKPFGWKKLKEIMEKAMSGLATKSGLSRSEMYAQKLFLFKQLRLNYLDSLTGGRLNRLLSGRLRLWFKRLLKVVP